ncbi:mitochondrion protein [Lentinula edodes]|uniref:Cytochrome c oxidase assembly factor 3 n=1 Tax=Lentinula edodes TaxID=5353 RepID=A0A1Q3E0R2_LENED|nr:mitochondrion protein [Lentinula edodes]
MNRKYVDPRLAAKTWRPKSGSMSPGLKRARAPFLVRNTLTGVLLGAFAVGVYTYSIRAVRQDDFADIDDETNAQREKERLAQLEKMRRESATVLTVGEEKDVMERAAKAVAREINGASLDTSVDETSSSRASQPQSSPVLTAVATQRSRRGVLVGLLDKTLPGALDPTKKTLVWGAPDVDNIGRVSSRN